MSAGLSIRSAPVFETKSKEKWSLQQVNKICWITHTEEYTVAFALLRSIKVGVSNKMGASFFPSPSNSIDQLEIGVGVVEEFLFLHVSAKYAVNKPYNVHVVLHIVI